MPEMILKTASLLLGLFCLLFCVRRRREVYFPLPRGLSEWLKNRHAAYLAMLGALTASAIASLAEGLMADAPRWLGAAYLALQAVLLLAFAHYAVALFSRGHPGAARGRDRAAFMLLALIAAVGVALRAIWDIRVELFFEALALFGCAVLLEQDEAPSARGANRCLGTGVTLAVGLTLLAVIAMNVTLILNFSNAQSEEIGNTQLDVIRSDLQETITEAETGVLYVAMGAEQLMEAGASREALAEYFNAQRDKYRASDSFLNVYIAGRDWHIVPDFNAPEGFHAAERVWYIGAQDCPGEVDISEPYMDANGQGMCFTVSTLLSDGETVVGMDLNFSKAQESILRMTQGKDRTAMIVTSGGMIAGYTDMSLVGERADEKLPEYADILRRVKASREHGSFRAEIDGRPNMIFSSETSNN